MEKEIDEIIDDVLNVFTDGKVVEIRYKGNRIERIDEYLKWKRNQRNKEATYQYQLKFD